MLIVLHELQVMYRQSLTRLMPDEGTMWMWTVAVKCSMTLTGAGTARCRAKSHGRPGMLCAKHLDSATYPDEGTKDVVDGSH